jgi:hypothetical protein
MRCCPKEPARKIPRSIHEDARVLPVRSPTQWRANDPAATENVSRCCLPISSASPGLAVSGCAARAARKTSSRSLRSLRTYAASRSSSPDRHHGPWRALRKRRIHQYQCVKAAALSGRTANTGTASRQCPANSGTSATKSAHMYGPAARRRDVTRGGWPRHGSSPKWLPRTANPKRSVEHKAPRSQPHCRNCLVGDLGGPYAGSQKERSLGMSHDLL